MLLGMYVLTAFGITVGFHRLFVHRSLETYTWVKLIFAVMTSMAVEGSLRYVKDLSASRALRVASFLTRLWVTIGLAIPSILGGVITQSWRGVLTGFLWGGLIRIFLVHHVTWSVNSACHLWGFRPYKSNDMSRNNFLFGILAMGEGWHNTHHAFPTSARHGLRWWQLDLSYGVIRTLALLGLAWNLKLPTKEARQRNAELPKRVAISVG